MTHPKYLLANVLLACTLVSGWGQQTYRSCYGFDCKREKWSLSFFTGYSLLGPGADIKEQFVESGFDDRIPMVEGLVDNNLSQSNPRAKAGLIWNIEGQYLLSPKAAIGITLGTLNHQTVTGYDSIGNGNLLNLRFQTYSGSIKYIYRLRRGRDEVSFGPVLTRMSIQDDASHHEGINSSPFKVGLGIGYSFALLQKRSWFISLKTNYTWLPSTEIGPYTKEHKAAIDQEIPNVYSSVFEQTDVRLSSMYVGLSTGWRW